MRINKNTVGNALRRLNRMPGKLSGAFRRSPLLFIVVIPLSLTILISLIVYFSGGQTQTPPESTTPAPTSPADTDGTAPESSPDGSGSAQTTPEETTAPPATGPGALGSGELKSLTTEEKRDGTVILTVNILYYEFANPSESENVTALNAAVLAAAQEFYNSAVTDLLSFAEDEYKSSSPTLPYYFNANCTIHANSEDILSLSFAYERFAGENDRYTGEHALNLNAATGAVLAPAEIFSADAAGYSARIYGYLSKIIEQSPESYHASISDKDYDLLKYYKLDNRMYLARSGLVVFYNPHEIAPGSEGIKKFTVPYSEIEDILAVKPVFEEGVSPPIPDAE